MNTQNKDLKTYDIGAFYIATDLMSGSGVGMGVVCVEYEVEFSVPQPRVSSENGESCAVTSSAAAGVSSIDVNGLQDLYMPTINSDTVSILKAGTYRVFSANAGNSTIPTFTATPVGAAVTTNQSNSQGGSSAGTVFDLVVSSAVNLALAKLASTKWSFTKLY